LSCFGVHDIAAIHVQYLSLSQIWQRYMFLFVNFFCFHLLYFLYDQWLAWIIS